MRRFFFSKHPFYFYPLPPPGDSIRLQWMLENTQQTHDDDQQKGFDDEDSGDVREGGGANVRSPDGRLQSVHARVESVVAVHFREGEGGGLREDGRRKKTGTGEQSTQQQQQQKQRELSLPSRDKFIVEELF